ncbi:MULTISPECIES: nuclear transport factor 2 family protein [Xanthomonas]|uniref:SnoaL-like domain-containing protein n=1 Tax=Xanthomonas phaseoli pv. dieffenbachiae TaxID=92828 RepID=A0A1V9HC01_9XANT|nr:nuclear transport factor 2 family protein [Xanthomonas phaseoli]MBO9769700.1 nuclear transport factor 2 family protein [Xanthomonas phaseoli pv. dieffenbachiae]MBO9777866.1 nuclear transport factor 2 family protein [Xanthomonas phaseoli pv. dieffenbachiae]MBO9782208.1 nuclear transport factor 2 family protein [Xanthomonas phaseoli pv. dieffenbachiae]MBO9790163.1 nuclear transport factor 2 family protein [Xanthomonas phaseoli pv. dieffenbachiae]MBO9798259.1 nuclear transport factor 2 family 
MTNQKRSAIEIAQSYFNAIRDKDVATILAMSADDVVCTSPLGTVEGREAFEKFQTGFSRMLQRAELYSALAGDTHATVVYEADTVPVKGSFVSELLVIEEGLIKSTHVIYDYAPYATFVASLQKS